MSRKNNRLYAVSLGCPKARTDLESVIADLMIAGWEYVGVPERADLILVNTCGFIDAARQETLNVITDLRQRFPDANVMAMGCMVEGFRDQVAATGANILAGIRDMPKCTSRIAGHKRRIDPAIRLISTPIPWTYLKIAEGCNRRCSFCIIPKLRGRQRSQTVDALVNQARDLVSMGYREIVLVAQDLTAYGRDIGTDLVTLLKAVSGVEGLHWLRLLYLHPAGVTDELLEVMAQSRVILPYFDIPVQHASDPVLRAMRRGTPQRLIWGILQKVRERIPNSVIRTTFITGFPGETDADFEKLVKFVREQPVDLGGVFDYSAERLSASFSLPNRVDRAVIDERSQRLGSLLHELGNARLQRFVGQRVPAVIYDRIGNHWVGRTWFQAPEIDGDLVVTGKASVGFQEVEITKIRDFRVFARV